MSIYMDLMSSDYICLKGPATEDTDTQPDKWDTFYNEVKKRAAKAKAIAEKYGLVYVELQDKFEKLAQTAENTYWLADGVHPTSMGHEMIKREWLKAFKEL